jgi:hypothetical protein
MEVNNCTFSNGIDYVGILKLRNLLAPHARSCLGLLELL